MNRFNICAASVVMAVTSLSSVGCGREDIAHSKPVPDQLEDTAMQGEEHLPAQPSVSSALDSRAEKGRNLSTQEAPRLLPGTMEPSDLQQIKLSQWQGRFEKELRDPRWAQDMEMHLVNLALPEGVDFPAAMRVNSECRTNTCSLHFEFEHPGNIDGWLSEYVFALGPQLPATQAIALEGPNGKAQIYLFASK